jgi:hypothetical protein
MVIWKDGFTLDQGPLRVWNSNSSQNFIKDILEGYFPSELMPRFPEGGQFELSEIESDMILSIMAMVD